MRLDVSDQMEIDEAARHIIQALGGRGLAGLINMPASSCRV